MADIELVIKIPEEEYRNICLMSKDGIGMALYDWIANGIPLPKGHGDLIDADKIIHEMNEMKVQGETFTTAVNFAKILMREASTIIEADKTESEE